MTLPTGQSMFQQILKQRDFHLARRSEESIRLNHFLAFPNLNPEIQIWNTKLWQRATFAFGCTSSLFCISNIKQDWFRLMTALQCIIRIISVCRIKRKFDKSMIECPKELCIARCYKSYKKEEEVVTRLKK